MIERRQILIFYPWIFYPKYSYCWLWTRITPFFCIHEFRFRDISCYNSITETFTAGNPRFFRKKIIFYQTNIFEIRPTFLKSDQHFWNQTNSLESDQQNVDTAPARKRPSRYKGGVNVGIAWRRRRDGAEGAKYGAAGEFSFGDRYVTLYISSLLVCVTRFSAVR